MNISKATNLKELLEIKYEQLLKDSNTNFSDCIHKDFEKAYSKAIDSEFHKTSKELANDLNAESLSLHSILHSVHAVKGSIGKLWGQIFQQSILITDSEAFNYTVKFFPEFQKYQAKYNCDISLGLDVKKLEKLINLCLKSDDIKYIVSLGGGRVMDIQKFLGYKSRKTMVAFPTSLASHVYASPKIHALPVIKEFGYKLTIDGDQPHISFLDMHLLENLFQKNPRLIYAGLGDISAFITAKDDWILAKNKNGTERNYFVESLIEDVIHWLKNFKIEDNFETWAKDYHLTQVLLCNITDWEGSAPASGSEHLFALSIEDFVSEPLPLHGELVALGVIIMSVLQGQDHIGISELIDRLRLPRKLSRIGIDRNILIQGFSNSLAKGVAKNRYTVLNEITNPNKVINDIYHTLNKNQIILD